MVPLADVDHVNTGAAVTYQMIPGGILMSAKEHEPRQ